MIWICDEGCVKKCMEFRVEGRSPVGSHRRTWLERTNGRSLLDGGPCYEH